MKKILIVDDDKALHELIRTSLSKEGHQIYSSFDTVQGMAIAKKENPDLLILDISMPGGGGFELYRRLKNISVTSQIPILIFTASPQQEIVKEIPSFDPSRILTKPSSLDEIRQAVKSTMAAAS